MLEWIISSSILIVFLVLIRIIFKGKIRLTLQYALWLIALVRLLLPLSIGTAEISVANLKETAKQQSAVQTVIEIGNISVSEQSYEDAYHQVAQQYHSNGIDVDALEGEALDAMELEVQTAMKGKTVAKILIDVMTCVWIAGIFIVGGMFLYTNLRFYKKLREKRTDSGIRNGNIPVWVFSDLDTPCLFGVFAPGIYISRSVLDNPIRLRHILEHEQTHYRHGDHIWSFLRGVCVALHWYNPLVWYAAFLSQRDGELACDEATIKRLGESERGEYGRTLIDMTCRKKVNILVTATTMNASKNGIKERIQLIAKKPRMAAITLIVVLLIAAIAIGCTFTGAEDQGVTAETLPTEEQPANPSETTNPTKTTRPTETPKPTETVEPTKLSRNWPYGEINDSDTVYPPVVVDVVDIGPLYQEPVQGKICIGLFTTFTGERMVYIIPENQEELLAAFKNAYSEGSMGEQALGPVGSMSIHFKGVKWYIGSDGAVFLSNFGDDNILPPEASAELIALCEAAAREAGIADPVKPEDIMQIESVTLHWGGEQTITDTERLECIESLLSNSRELGYMGACPFDSLLTMEFANGKTLIVAMSNDSCGTWMSNGACYSFYPLDSSDNDGNRPFYDLFAMNALHNAAGGRMENIAYWLDYLDWDRYGERYGDQEVRYLMNQYKVWIQESYDERLVSALWRLPNRNSNYSGAYAAMLTQLYEDNPKAFARICLDELFDSQQETVFRLLGQYWGINLNKVRGILKEAESAS